MGNSKREADVLGIIETWLNTTYSDSSVAIDSYNLERRDRSTGRGGGVAVYLHDSVSYNRRHDLEKDQLEDLWVEIKCPCSIGILLGTVYRHLDNTRSDNWCSLIESTLETTQGESKETILMGDININFVNGVVTN
jgi:exonuclease III